MALAVRISSDAVVGDADDVVETVAPERHGDRPFPLLIRKGVLSRGLPSSRVRSGSGFGPLVRFFPARTPFPCAKPKSIPAACDYGRTPLAQYPHRIREAMGTRY